MNDCPMIDFGPKKSPLSYPNVSSSTYHLTRPQSLQISPIPIRIPTNTHAQFPRIRMSMPPLRTLGTHFANENPTSPSLSVARKAGGPARETNEIGARKNTCVHLKSSTDRPGRGVSESVSHHHRQRQTPAELNNLCQNLILLAYRALTSNALYPILTAVRSRRCLVRRRDAPIGHGRC